MKAKILLSVIVTVLLLTPCAFARLNPDQLTKFENALEKSGFDWNTGRAEIMDWAEEYCHNEEIPNAGYVNKAPYIRLRVPESQDPKSELVDSFQLRHDEAIVMIGVNPPPVNYFGYYAFLWTRPGEIRPLLQATVADAVNNATINAIGPTPYNSPVAMIFTPDKGTDANIRSALLHAGYPTAITNTMVFPASMLNLGHGDTGDEFRIGLRLGQWKGDQTAGKSFMQSVSDRLKVIRITPRKPAIADPFPAPPMRVRGTGRTEMDWMNKLGELRQSIITANPGLHATDIATKPNWYEGYDYIQQGKNPGSDVRDAFLLSAGWLPEYDSFEKITLADDEFLMVYGVNHVTTGKATYMSINTYASWEAKLSIGQVFEKDLMDTATFYLAGDPAAKAMYAYKVSRNCGGELNCMPLFIDDCPRLEINSDTILALIIRMYLEPATKVGPAMQEILYDRIMKFSPRSSVPED